MLKIVNMCQKGKSLLFEEFVRPLIKIITREGHECKTFHYTQLPEISSTDKIILSGTALKDNFFIHGKDNFKWLKTVNVPVLGICAGMQAIAGVFGSRLEKAQEIGMTRVRVISPDAIFSGKRNFDAYELHNFSVVPSTDFKIIAVSELCVQAIKHRKRPIYGVMFHPEVRNEWVIRRFLSL